MVAITADPLLIPAAAVDLDTIAADSLITADAAIGLPVAVVKPVSLMLPLSLIPSLSLFPNAAARCCARCSATETGE
jgi:hypothetical protein